MNIDRILPQFFPKTWEEKSGVYGITFTGEVSLGFVFREEGGYSYLLTDQIMFSPEHLLERALGNLRKLDEGVEIKLGHPLDTTVLWVEAPDNFVAVRLLLPSVIDFAKEKIGPQFLFTIPSRDLLLCWDLNARLSLTEKHLQEAQEDYESEEYNLSPHVYQYSDHWPCRRAR